MDGHDTLAKSFIEKFPFYMKRPKNVEKELGQLVQHLRNANFGTFLFSSEQFEFAVPEKVREFFEAVWPNPRFKIVYVVRQQDELAESEYGQLLKVGRLSCTFLDFVERHFDGDFYSVAKNWSAVFGESSVDVLPYLPHEDSTKTVLQNIGVSAETLTSKMRIRQNQSLCLEQLIAIRELLRQGYSHTDPKVLKIRSELLTVRTSAIFFDAENARRFRDRFSASNELLVNEFMKESCFDHRGRKYNDTVRDEVRARAVLMENRKC